MNSLARFVWGWLMDKFGFRTLMFIISSIEVTISIILYFSVKYTLLYVILILITASNIGGHFSIISPTFTKIFGLQYGPEMYGITGNFIGFANLCGPVFAKLIIKDNKDYLVVFLIGGFLCLIKLILLIKFNENERFLFKGEKAIEKEDIITEISGQPVISDTSDDEEGKNKNRIN